MAEYAAAGGLSALRVLFLGRARTLQIPTATKLPSFYTRITPETSLAAGGIDSSPVLFDPGRKKWGDTDVDNGKKGGNSDDNDSSREKSDSDISNTRGGPTAMPR